MAFNALFQLGIRMRHQLWRKQARWHSIVGMLCLLIWASPHLMAAAPSFSQNADPQASDQIQPTPTESSPSDSLPSPAASSAAVEQDPISPTNDPEADQPAADAPTIQQAMKTEANRKQLRAKAWAGLAALAGIVISGVMLILLVLIWARRLKRLNRRPLPPQHRLPEYWFVNKTPPVTPPQPANPSPALDSTPPSAKPNSDTPTSPRPLQSSSEDDRPTPAG
jgi:4-amino-4-deoxy-L-arabinose transferase-like glycosyltransferase